MICDFSLPVEIYGHNWEYSRITCVTPPTPPLPIFSYGELVISFLLFVLIVGGFSFFVFSRFFGLRISKSRQ